MDIENKQHLINELIERGINKPLTLPVEAIYNLEDINEAVSSEVKK